MKKQPVIALRNLPNRFPTQWTLLMILFADFLEKRLSEFDYGIAVTLIVLVTAGLWMLSIIALFVEEPIDILKD